MERAFEFKQWDEETKYKMSILKLKGFASVWLENLKSNRRREGKPKITTWGKLKKHLYRKFLPRDYEQGLYIKMTRLRQGASTVEEYTHEFEKLMMLSNIEEREAQTVARYIGGLHVSIQDKLEVTPFKTLEEATDLAMKFERQLKKTSRPQSKPNYPSQRQVVPIPKGGNFKGSKEEDKRGKGREVTTPQDKSKKRCYKCQGFGHFAAECPNSRTLTLQEFEEADQGYMHEESPFEDEYNDDDEGQMGSDGETLVLTRVLHLESEEEVQREQLFYARCKVGGKVCSLIVDSGSCTNVASKEMVDKLKLELREHPKPYALQWLNKDKGLKVTKQALVNFEIATYVDSLW